MKLGWILLPKAQYPIEISCGSLPVTDLQIAGLPEYIRVTFFFLYFVTIQSLNLSLTLMEG